MLASQQIAQVYVVEQVELFMSPSRRAVIKETQGRVRKLRVVSAWNRSNVNVQHYARRRKIVKGSVRLTLG